MPHSTPQGPPAEASVWLPVAPTQFLLHAIEESLGVRL
jgi:hypothetical protein